MTIVVSKKADDDGVRLKRTDLVYKSRIEHDKTTPKMEMTAMVRKSKKHSIRLKASKSKTKLNKK